MPISKAIERGKNGLIRATNKRVGTKWVEVLPRNPARKGIMVFNPTNTTVFLDFGKPTQKSYMFPLPPGTLWESPWPCEAPLVARAEQNNVELFVRDFS